MRSWRTCNNRRAKRQHSNALIVTVWNVNGAVSQHGVHPLPNAHERGMLAAFGHEAQTLDFGPK